MTIFFTSDTHFGDHRVLNIRPRPFGSVKEMNEEMVQRWNSRVAKRDIVWHLGDFASDTKAAQSIFPRLNGRKHLISGNIDREGVRSLGWSSVQAYAEITIGRVMLVLCHYPFRTWNGIHRGAINLHGHSHGRLRPFARQYDVGVDAHGFQPIHLTELLAREGCAAGGRAGQKGAGR
jgi:calcineurin-like phosphoesterase family protein